MRYCLYRIEDGVILATGDGDTPLFAEDSRNALMYLESLPKDIHQYRVVQGKLRKEQPRYRGHLAREAQERILIDREQRFRALVSRIGDKDPDVAAALSLLASAIFPDNKRRRR